MKFLNIAKVKYDWDNKELDENEGIVEDEITISQYPGIPTEILETDLEYDFYDGTDAIEAVPVPDRTKRVAAAAVNANLVCTPGVSTYRIAGVNWTIIDISSDG